jgi:hypothetical protein
MYSILGCLPDQKLLAEVTAVLECGELDEHSFTL